MSTKLTTLSEVAVATAVHGLYAYIGTNKGNLYRVLISSGATTLIDSVDEAIIALSVDHPNLYFTTNRGSIYSYAIDAAVEPYAAPIVGANANVIGSGVILTRSGTNTAASRLYCDDGGAVLWGTGSVPDIRGSLTRTLLTVDQSGGFVRIHSLMGQVKAYDALWNDEVVSAVNGRLEIQRVAATVTLGGHGISAAILGVTATTGTITVNTNHILAGVAAVSDFRATLTQTGKTVAFLAAAYDTTNWSDGTARTTWGIGLYMPYGAVTQGIRVGDWVGSGAPGSAIPFSTSLNFYGDGQLDVVGCYGESVSDLTSALSAKTGRFRHVVVGSSLQVNHETYGLVGQLVGKSASLLHMHAGLMGTLEANTTALVCNGAYAFSVAAVIARIGGGGLITATKPVAGFSAVLNGADVASGSIVAFAACATSTGNWTHLLASGSCDNILYAPTGTSYECGVKIATQLTGNSYPKMDGVIRIMINTTAYYIPFYAAGNIDNE